jgi:hypothetical protein
MAAKLLQLAGLELQTQAVVAAAAATTGMITKVVMEDQA